MLDDPVTVIIDVEEVPVHELGLAHAGTFVNLSVARYDNLRAALIADATSDNDLLAISHLPDLANLTFRAVEPDGPPALFDGAENINMYLAIHAGLFDVMDIEVDPIPKETAGRIAWNTSFLDIGDLLDRDRSDGISGADLVSIAAQEIGHALGFDSFTGVFDETSFPNGPYAPENQREYRRVDVSSSPPPAFDVERRMQRFAPECIISETKMMSRELVSPVGPHAFSLEPALRCN